MTKIRPRCPLSKLFEGSLVNRPLNCFHCHQAYSCDCEICLGLTFDRDHVPSLPSKTFLTEAKVWCLAFVRGF